MLHAQGTRPTASTLFIARKTHKHTHNIYIYIYIYTYIHTYIYIYPLESMVSHSVLFRSGTHPAEHHRSVSFHRVARVLGISRAMFPANNQRNAPLHLRTRFGATVGQRNDAGVKLGKLVRHELLQACHASLHVLQAVLQVLCVQVPQHACEGVRHSVAAQPHHDQTRRQG